MSTKQQSQQHADQEALGHQQMQANITKNVIQTLGQPRNLHRIQVRQLWEDHYRVNIFVGTDAASAKVIHSYFLVTHGDGSIVTASPKITKQY